MQIVDAQIHLWGTGLPSNLSHRQVTHFTPEEAIALMDEGGVDAAVIHPPGWDPNSTDMAFKAVRDYPGRFAIMGSLPLDKPDSRARIAGWRNQPGMLGLRYTFLHDPARHLAGRRHDRLALGGGRKGRRPDRHAGDRFAGGDWPDRRAPSRTAADDRSPGRPRRPDHAEGCRGDDPHAGASGAGEVSQCRGQGDRRAGLFRRGLSVSDHADVSAADLRRVRPASHVLGHRHHQDAVLLAPMRDDVHRGTAVAQRARTSGWSWARRCAPGGAGTGPPERQSISKQQGSASK